MVTPAPVERPGPRTTHLRRRLLAPILAAALLCVAAAPDALAAPPNDDFASATAVASVPFSHTVDTTGATLQPDEPQFCNPADTSVWYAVTASEDTLVSASVEGWYGGSPQLNAYRQDGAGLAGLTFLSCTNYNHSPATFAMQAGSTYYLQASPSFFSGPQLTVRLETVTAPANDDFADAKAFSAVPFDDQPNLTAASTEAGEPTACAGFAQNTVWYAFTPSETGSYVVERSGGFQPLAVYTGGSLASLHEVACAGYNTPLFRGEAGHTYYLQLAGGGGYGSGTVGLTVRAAPAATASFFHYPSDPSTFDTIQFYDASFDIGGIASRLWGFGDGATATGCCPAHRYAADGEYAAKLDITTGDGRSASTTQTVTVKTHDVSITRMSVPKTARVGQTRQLSVAVASGRYAETVEVALLRSVAGAGFERVGQVVQEVPAGGRGRNTTFAISYTIAPDDAERGKVSFQAVASILNARDASPADNTIIALPTKITR